MSLSFISHLPFFESLKKWCGRRVGGLRPGCDQLCPLGWFLCDIMWLFSCHVLNDTCQINVVHKPTSKMCFIWRDDWTEGAKTPFMCWFSCRLTVVFCCLDQWFCQNGVQRPFRLWFQRFPSKMNIYLFHHNVLVMGFIHCCTETTRKILHIGGTRRQNLVKWGSVA